MTQQQGSRYKDLGHAYLPSGSLWRILSSAGTAAIILQQSE